MKISVSTAGIAEPPRRGTASRLKALGTRLCRPPVLSRLGALLLAALYLRTVSFDFVYDDASILLAPPLESWKSVLAVFRHDIFGLQGVAGSIYYRPMGALWLVVLRNFTGIPAWFHLCAVGIHLAVYGLAYEFGKLVLRDERVALLAAFLFSLHPARVESVAWIGSAGCDGLGAIFFFGCLVLYLKWREEGRPRLLAASLACFAAALFTKETLAIALALIAGHYWFTTTRHRRVLRFLALASAYGMFLLGYLALRHSALGHPSESATFVRPSFGMDTLWTVPTACWWYLKHFLFPAGLSVMYDFTPEVAPSWRGFVLPGVALLVLTVGVVLVLVRRRSVAGFLLFALFMLALGPYAILAPHVQVHDRYSYLAYYPLCALLASWLLHAGEDSPRRTYERVAACALLVVFWSAAVWHESGFWRNDVSLWKRSVQVSPSLVQARVLLAQLYIPDQPAQALQVLDEGLVFRPNSLWLWQERGEVFYSTKSPAAARQAFQKVIALSGAYEKDVQVRNARTRAAYHLGMLDLQERNYADATDWLQMAAALKPGEPTFRFDLAMALRAQGRMDDAAQQAAIGTQMSRRIAANR